MSQRVRSYRYGKGTHIIGPHESLEMLTSEDITLLLLDTFRSPRYSPPMLPVVAIELMQLTRDPSATTKQITELIERDPWLATRTIKVARSPAFGAAQITSLRDAVVRLGNNGIKQCILQACLQGRVFKLASHQPLMAALYDHSVLTARIARIIGQYTSLYEEYAYLCGLLHDIGIVGGLLALAERQRDLPSIEVLARALHEAHEEGGKIIGEAWDLPPDILHVISTHHLDIREQYTHPLSAIICLAEHLAHTLGPRTPHPELDHSGLFQLKHARDSIRLDDGRWARIQREITAMLEEENATTAS